MVAALMWTCGRSGDCCTKPARITMTHAERRRVEAAADRLGLLRRLQWRAAERPRFTDLVGRPCPLFGKDADGLPACLIYEDRPFNCRRFMCGREAGSTEAYDLSVVHGIPLRVLTSDTLRTDYAANLTPAQAWADIHGWRPDAAK